MIHTVVQTAKFKLLVRRLRPLLPACPVSVETIAVGLLERLWHVASTSSQRGDIGRHDDELIAEMVGWNGDATTLIDTLVQCKWLDMHPDCRLVIHDWHAHAPNFVKANVTKIGGFVTERGPASGEGPHRPGLIGPASGEGPMRRDPSNLTKPNLTQPNPTKPEEEDSSEPPKAAASEPAAAIVLTFATVGKGPKTWPLTDRQIAEWQTAYPALNVLAECRKAHAWIVANPQRAKTAKGMPAFLCNWLNRATNSAHGPTPTAGGQFKSRGQREDDYIFGQLVGLEDE